jgi:hypothetical protein
MNGAIQIHKAGHANRQSGEFESLVFVGSTLARL